MFPQNIFSKLNSEYYKLTSSEKKVADFVIANGTVAQSMSISELAEACDVAEATISRFCRRLEYDGYPSFKLAIATAQATRKQANPLTGEVKADDPIPELARKLAGANIDAILETQGLLDPLAIQAAADLLVKADRVLCMGQGGSMLLAHEAAHLFSTAFSKFFSVSGSHMQVIKTAQLSEQDVILYFSYSGSTHELMDLLRLAKARRVKVLLITRFSNSPGALEADLVLQCGSTETPLQLGSIPARVAQLYLIDVLFSEICRRDLEGCKQRRALVADALSAKHV